MERGSTRSRSVENSLWERVWAWRETVCTCRWLHLPGHIGCY